MAQNRLDNGAFWSILTEDATHWILTTNRPGA
jgi:hypothetical protein